MSDADVLFERDGHVGLITLNRPERLNAITTAMIAELPTCCSAPTRTATCA